MPVLFWNIAGVQNKCKKMDVWKELWEFFKKFNVIILLETWVEEKQWEQIKNILDKNYRWKVQYAVKKNIKGRAMGGIISGVKRHLNEVEIDDIVNNDTIGLIGRKIVVKDHVWNIMGVYINGNMSEITNEIDRRIEGKNENEKIIVGGDWNARIGNENVYNIGDEGECIERMSKDGLINVEGKKLIKWVREKEWTILNGGINGDLEGEWTYIGPNGKSVIDYVVVNEVANREIDCLKVCERIESDHQPIMIETIWSESKKETNQSDKIKEEYMWNEKTKIDWMRKCNGMNWANVKDISELTQLVKNSLVKRVHEKKKKNETRKITRNGTMIVKLRKKKLENIYEKLKLE